MSESFTREELEALLDAEIGHEFERGPFTGGDLELHQRLVAKLRAAIQAAPVVTGPHTDHTQDGPEAQ